MVQHRERLFIVAARQAAAGAEPTEAGTGASVLVHQLCRRHLAAIEKPGRAVNTLARQAVDTPPVGTVTTRDRHAIVDGNGMRMFSGQECRTAMGFPADYKLPTQHRLAVHMLGNAVCPPAARDVILALGEAA